MNPTDDLIAKVIIVLEEIEHQEGLEAVCGY